VKTNITSWLCQAKESTIKNLKIKQNKTKQKKPRAGDLIQMIKYQPNKHKVLSSNSSGTHTQNTSQA
jgi:hypothetical protein